MAKQKKLYYYNSFSPLLLLSAFYIRANLPFFSDMPNTRISGVLWLLEKRRELKVTCC